MKIVLSLIIVLFSFTLEAGDKLSIADWAGSVTPLTVGSQIPDVNLWTGNGDPVHLKRLIKKRPTVIMFYQGYWSPYCSEQLDNIQTVYKKLKNMGYQILAISPDSPHKLQKSTKKKHLNYMLLSDYHLEAARSFGLAYSLSKEGAMKIKKKYGADLRHIKGEELYNLPVPGVFIVDTQGKIHFQYVNPDIETQLSSGLLIEAAKMVSMITKNTPKKES
ncbi:MAG: peroxiredoxin [Enterobacterales bacterium]|jgi:peroxiredoxin